MPRNYPQQVAGHPPSTEGVEYNGKTMMPSRVFSRVAAGIAISAAVLLGGSVQSLAQTTATPKGGVVLATVNITDAKIVSQKGNAFEISFRIGNRIGIQTGVKYGVELVASTETSQTVVDQKVYPETLTLGENSSIQKTITYTAPDNVSGTYKLFLTSKDESAFPFALAFVGDVKLAASNKSVAIDPASCYLQVAGERDGHRFGLIQGVDITDNEHLVLTCVAINSAPTKVTATPSYETRYRSVYGDIVSQVGGDTTPLSFNPGEKKSFSLTLPKATKPQAYNVSVSLVVNGVASNAVSAHYIMNGSSATVQTLSLNKNSYAKGDTAMVTFVWAPSADAFPNARIEKASPSAVTAHITIADAAGAACATPVDETLPGSARMVIPILITKDCVGSQASLALSDAKGTVLAERKLTMLPSTEYGMPGDATSASPITTSTAMSIALIVLIIIGGTVYLIRKSSDMNQTPPAAPPAPPLP